MRTSLNDIKQTEDFIFQKVMGLNSLLFEAKLLTDPALRMNVNLQKRIYSLVRIFHRRKLKQQMEQVHQRLFNDPRKHEFQQKIFQLFNS
jgi:hypothetical protein